jgi:hypothetical protein
MQVNILMKQLENVKADRARNFVRIRRTLATAGITLKTVIKEQSVLKTNTSIRRQNTVRISAQQVVRIQMTFNNAESVHRKVKFCNMIVIPTPYAQVVR